MSMRHRVAPHYPRMQVTVDRTEIENEKALFAREIIRFMVTNPHWTPDAETTVTRAVEIADKAYAEFERRGWIHHIPQEIFDQVNEQNKQH